MTDQNEGVAASLAGLRSRFEAIAHNLANCSTPSFKRRRVRFEQAMVQANGRTATTQGTGAIDFTQGALEQTNRPLDFALDGKGFFALETPKGTLYTRSGAFTPNANRQLVDTSGQLVAGQNGPIVMPPKCDPADVLVTPDGQIKAGGTTIGKLKVVDFVRTSDLRPMGAGCYRAPADSPTVPPAGTVRQGYQEASNVNTVQELVDLIQVTRLYEANLKNMTASDDRTKDLLQVAMS